MNKRQQKQAVLAALTDEERAEAFRRYCVRCGSDNPRCRCWNDEEGERR